MGQTSYIFSKAESFKLTLEISKYGIFPQGVKKLYAINPKVPHGVHNSLPLVPIISHSNPVPAPSHSDSWRTILILYYLGLGVQSGHSPQVSHENLVFTSPSHVTHAPPLSFCIIWTAKYLARTNCVYTKSKAVTSKIIPNPGLIKPQLTLSNTILTIYIYFGRPDLAARDCRNLCAVRAKTLARLNVMTFIINVIKVFSPTVAQLDSLKNNFKICIKIEIKKLQQVSV